MDTKSYAGKIDKSIPIPLYYQLQTILLDEINSGALKPGDAIPTEMQLSEIYGLSRTTVRQAIMGLVMEGKLYRIKSKGTFVATPKLVQDFMRKIESFDDQIRHLGLKPSTRVLEISYEKPSTDVAEAFKSKDDVIRLCRLRYADQDPIVIVNTYLPGFCKDIFNEDLNQVRLYDFLSRNSRTRIHSVTRQIEAVAAGKYESKLLVVPVGSPIQLTTTCGFSASQEVIEYSVARYRGDKSKFVVELHM